MTSSVPNKLVPRYSQLLMSYMLAKFRLRGSVQVFPCEFCEIFINTFFQRTFPVVTFANLVNAALDFLEFFFQMTLDIALRKTNAGQKILFLLSPTIWDKPRSNIKTATTTDFFTHVLKKSGPKGRRVLKFWGILLLAVCVNISVQFIYCLDSHLNPI